MNYSGKPPAIYEYYKDDELIGSGTIEEISESLGITKHSLWNKVSRHKLGKTKRVKHELIEIQDSVNEYVMLYKGEFVGVGTIKELSVISSFCREYLTKLCNGWYSKEGFKKQNEIQMFKKVG